MHPDPVIQHYLRLVDPDALAQSLHHLCADPLPCRQLNVTLPGHAKNTLDETDDYLAARLQKWHYHVDREPVRVQCFRRDETKPLQHQYSRPAPEDPWYDACNLYARRPGREHPDEITVILGHKDSQSWIPGGCPAASDNGVGTVGNLEIARVLADYEPRRGIWHLWCNEEHTPWTSRAAAAKIAASPHDVLMALNLDGLGRNRQEDRAAGRRTNVTRYTTPEGEALADLMARLNEVYGIGLVQTKVPREKPGDDDGSFIDAGIPRAIVNIGCHPYNVPDYHTTSDRPELVDIENLAMATRLSLAAVLHIDRYGLPEGA